MSSSENLSSRLGATEEEKTKPDEQHALFSIPRGEVVRRLRERGEPIRLFGESDRDVCLRLRQLELLDTETVKVCPGVHFCHMMVM